MRGRWTERWRPFAPWLALAAGLLAVAPAALAPLWDADLWWIVTAGDAVLRGEGVPRVNGWSFTAPTRPWVMHEWLLGVSYAALTRASLATLALVRVGAVAAVVFAAWRRPAHPLARAAALWCALLVFGGRFESARPVGVVAALAAVFASVAFDPRFGRGHALALAAMSALWANVHGSFPLGVAIALCAAVEATGDRRARWAAVAGVCLATLATPYGPGLHALVLRYVTGADGDATAVVHARVLEWWPLWRAPLRVATAGELAGTVGLTVTWVMALRERRWRGRALLGLALVAMALRHNRHLGLAGVVGATLAAEVWSSWMGAEGEAAPRWRWLPLAVMAAGALAWAPVAVGRTESEWVDPTRDDDDVRALVEAMPRGARVWATLPYTGWVLRHRPQGARVYWDSRNDCYPAEVLRVAFDVNDGVMAPEAAAEALSRAGTTRAVAPCASRAARSLARWRVLARRGGQCVWGP